MKINTLVYSALFAALTAVGAVIIIPLPFSPVPITLQTFFTFLAGGLLGSKAGAISQILYLFLGAVGLPVFSGGQGGLPILAGPTGGFLLALPLAAFIAGINRNNKKSNIISFSIALIIIYIFGVSGLMLQTGLNLKEAILTGMAPFLIGDALKIFVAIYIVDKIPAKFKP